MNVSNKLDKIVFCVLHIAAIFYILEYNLFFFHSLCIIAGFCSMSARIPHGLFYSFRDVFSIFPAQQRWYTSLYQGIFRDYKIY